MSGANENRDATSAHGVTGSPDAKSSSAVTSSNPAIARWYRAEDHRGGRLKQIAITSCLLAALVGTIIGIARLPAARPNTVLVSLYIPPPEELTVGTDAPHPPEADRLFGLKPANRISTETPADRTARDHAPAETIKTGSGNHKTPDNKQTNPDKSQTTPDKKQTTPEKSRTDTEGTNAQGTDPGDTAANGDESVAADHGSRSDADSIPADSPRWHDAVRKISRRDQLVFHVAAIPRVEHGQVFFIGRGDRSKRRPDRTPSPVASLSEVLAAVQQSPAREKLLILNVHWPLRSDDGDPSTRLKRLNRTIRAQLERFPDPDRLVVLGSNGKAPSRSNENGRRDLLSEYLTRAAASSDADKNHDGRVDLAEALRWAGPRIAAVSAATGEPQTIELVDASSRISAAVEWVLPASAGTAAIDRDEYPEWLAEGWDSRHRYLHDIRLPWLPELAADWGQRLAYLEARWRRGEDIASLRAEGKRIEAFASATIRDALDRRRNRRADSLRFAAARFDPALEKKADAAYASLWQEYLGIPTDLPDEARNALLDKGIKKYAAHFSPRDAVVAIDAVIEPMTDTTDLGRHRVRLANRVRAAWHATPQFPITEAIRLLDESFEQQPSDDRQLDQGRLRARIVRLYALQEQINGDPVTTAAIRPLAEKSTRHFGEAQQLLWSRGMASDEVVGGALRRAIQFAESVRVAEQIIGNTVRRAEATASTLEVDRSLGLTSFPKAEQNAIVSRIVKVGHSLRKLRQSVRNGNPVIANDLALVGQASEALRREWEGMLESYQTAFPGDAAQFHAGVSTAVNTPMRSELLTSNQRPNGFRPESSPATLTSIRSGKSDHQPQNVRPDAMPWTEIRNRFRSFTRAAESDYQSWWSTFLGATRDCEAISSYRSLSQSQSVAGDAKPIPVRIDGDPHSINWSDPSRTLNLRYLVDIPDASAVTFEFLDPVTKNLRVTPDRGSLQPGEKAGVALRLTNRFPDAGTIEGLWLRVTTDSQQQLIPVRIDSPPASPIIDVDFGPRSAADGRHVELAFWPNASPQPSSWEVTVRDPKIPAVVAKLRSRSGAELTSPPLAVTPGTPTPIRFLPPAKPKDRTAGTPPKVTAPFTLTVEDAGKGTELATWHVDARVRDPRTAIRLGDASYEVDDDGSNRLQVRVGLAPEAAGDQDEPPYTPSLRLGLDPSRVPSLIDAAQSRLRAELGPDRLSTLLTATDLHVAEAATSTTTVPLRIDGDDGVFGLDVRLPRRRGTVGLSWNRTPTLSLEAPTAIVPGNPLPVTVRARNLDARLPLMVECVDNTEGDGWVLWQHRLPTSREQQIEFETGGSHASVAVVARHVDWQLTLPSDFGNGDRRVRVKTAEPVGERTVVAEREVLFDDRTPDGVHARAEIRGDAIKLFASLRPGPSGIAEVSLRDATAPDPKKAVRVEAAPDDQGTARWQADWPSGQSVPKRIVVAGKTIAGQPFETTCDVSTQKVSPTARIVGQVLEGSIPQPGINVDVVRDGGKPIRTTRTDSDGRYQIITPPGRFTLRASKSSTGRVATATATVRDGQTANANLSLLKPTRK